MKTYLQINTTPLSCKENQIRGDRFRITLLTDRLIRFEYNESNVFEDKATQTVWNRDFPPVAFRIYESNVLIEIFTKDIHAPEHLQGVSRQHPADDNAAKSVSRSSSLSLGLLSPRPVRNSQ